MQNLTCPDFVAHPHKVPRVITDRHGKVLKSYIGYCYTCQVASASEELNQVGAILDVFNIPYTIDQTVGSGGFTMVLYVRKPGTHEAIGATTYCVGYQQDERDVDDYDENNITYFEETEFNPAEIAGEIVQQMVQHGFNLNNSN